MRYRVAETLDGERLESGRVSHERLERWRPDQDGNAVELLVDGEAFVAMRAAIEGAREELEVQTFQWADDETGRGIAERLMAKARAGVRVRCLVDASSKTVNDLIKKKDITAGLDDEMRAAGIEVIHQHGYAAGLGRSITGMGRGLWDGVRRLFGGQPAARERRALWNHDHRKLLVADRRVAFCGGMNIASEYEHEWHDVTARVEGPGAHAIHTLFVDRWNAACGKRDRRATVGEAPTFRRAPGDLRVQALGTIPGVDASIRDLYLREIAGARERVLIEVAYFLDDRILDALAAAERRGVRTVVVIPSDAKNDVYLVKEAFAWVHNEVVRSGVELYFYQPRLVHSKLAVFDGQRTTIGSSNLDEVALDAISEANIFVPDARFARLVERRIFEVDLPQCERAVERPLPWKRKVTAGSLHFFRSFL
jgi:cardiolipin synthase A/B